MRETSWRGRSCVALVRVCRRARARRARDPTRGVFSDRAKDTRFPRYASFNRERARRFERVRSFRGEKRSELRKKSAFRPQMPVGGKTLDRFSKDVLTRTRGEFDDTTGAIRLAGSGLVRRERALCGNLNFFPRLVAECQISGNGRLKTHTVSRSISLFLKRSRPFTVSDVRGGHRAARGTHAIARLTTRSETRTNAHS